MASILMVFVIPVFFNLSVALLTLVTGAAAMAALRWIIQKFRLTWLEDFALVFSMLAAMLLSLLWHGLLPAG
jgi:hypothetical protein